MDYLNFKRLILIFNMATFKFEDQCLIFFIKGQGITINYFGLSREGRGSKNRILGTRTDPKELYYIVINITCVSYPLGQLRID